MHNIFRIYLEVLGKITVSKSYHWGWNGLNGELNTIDKQTIVQLFVCKNIFEEDELDGDYWGMENTRWGLMIGRRYNAEIEIILGRNHDIDFSLVVTMSRVFRSILYFLASVCLPPIFFYLSSLNLYCWQSLLLSIFISPPSPISPAFYLHSHSHSSVCSYFLISYIHLRYSYRLSIFVPPLLPVCWSVYLDTKLSSVLFPFNCGVWR